MNDSLSSDFFSDAANEIESFSTQKEHLEYESVLAATKGALGSYKNELNPTTFPIFFGKVLKDCWTCISHSLENLIRGLLVDTSASLNEVAGYLTESACLLHMLSDFYKSILQSMPLTCRSTRTLPKQTGQIILTVFLHCRDSESLYGQYLKSVEKQLKDLFRICHDLQLTYLMIMEKHFIFDFAEMDDKEVLVNALKINLRIGNVVQSLDVKTMAEQWKGYTAICEKYSTYLTDTDVFQESVQILCTLIKNNLDTAIEHNQDEKVAVRSLKVTSFTIKILLKICTILKHTCNKSFGQIIELFRYICIINARCLEVETEKSFSSLMTSNVILPYDSLLKDLLLDDEFVTCLISSISSHEENGKDDENLFGCLLLTTGTMKCASQMNRRLPVNLKMKLVTNVYSLLPHSHFWLRRKLRLPDATQSFCSIFEHALFHITALATSMSNDEFNALEKFMLEAILSTDCFRALFSANMWFILARHISPQLLFNQLIWLCHIFNKLNSQADFYNTPQHIHMSHTMSGLFEIMDDDDKLKICKQFRIHDENNCLIWTALRIKNLPAESRSKAEEVIVEKLKYTLKRLPESADIYDLLKIVNLAATCLFQNTRGIEDLLVSAWARTCQEKQIVVQGLSKDTLWFYNYVAALVSLTDTLMGRLRENSCHFVIVLHNISGLIRTGDTEMKLLLTNILCKLASCDINENKILIDSYFTQSFTSLLQHSDSIVRDSFMSKLKHHRLNKYLESIMNENKEIELLIQAWMNLETRKGDSMESLDIKYTHRCIDAKIEMRQVTSSLSVQELKQANLDEFYYDSGGSEMLVDSDNEPSCKKVKPNAFEGDKIISSLEENASLLVMNNDYTPEQLLRIRNVCVILQKIKAVELYLQAVLVNRAIDQ